MNSYIESHVLASIEAPQSLLVALLSSALRVLRQEPAGIASEGLRFNCLVPSLKTKSALAPHLRAPKTPWVFRMTTTV